MDWCQRFQSEVSYDLGCRGNCVSRVSRQNDLLFLSEREPTAAVWIDSLHIYWDGVGDSFECYSFPKISFHAGIR